MFTVTLARKISPLGGLSALLGRNDKVRRPVRLRGFGCAFAAPLRVTGWGASRLTLTSFVILSSSRQGTMADGALRLPPRLLRLPLLFPKISLRCDFREPYKMRVEGSLKIMPEKGKTTLLPFSPYSGELPAGKVNLRGVFILNNTQKRKNDAFSFFPLWAYG